MRSIQTRMRDGTVTVRRAPAPAAPVARVSLPADARPRLDLRIARQRNRWHFVREAGLPAIFVLMLAESACIPIPSEATMLFAGFAVADPGGRAPPSTT